MPRPNAAETYRTLQYLVENPWDTMTMTAQGIAELIDRPVSEVRAALRLWEQDWN